MSVRWLLAAGAVVLAVLFAACGGASGGSAGAGEEKLKVVTSLGVFADFVRVVGSDRVDVTALLPPGADPHTFEPSPSDVRKVTEAKIVFINGHGLDTTVDKAIQANRPEGAPVVQLADEAIAAGTAVIEPDYHLWLDVNNAAQYARIIRDSLSEVDSKASATYNDNFERYLADLQSVGEYAQESASKIPPERRKLVTSHGAFAYFARYLGLEVVGFVARSPGQESSPRDVADLGQAIKEAGVPAVFVEPQVGSEGRVLQQIADDAGVKVCTLYSDALDEKVTSYLELMRFDADEVARCLAGGAGG